MIFQNLLVLFSHLFHYKKYYPEIIHIDNLYKRLAIYDIIYNLKHCVSSPHIKELKDDVLNAANIVVK